MKETCDGTEDLTLYFGVITPKIQKELGETPRYLALAKRESYDAAKGWGKGYLWFAPTGYIPYDPIGMMSGGPFWDLKDKLFAAILHEISHLFGNEHLGGTIMSGKLAIGRKVLR